MQDEHGGHGAVLDQDGHGLVVGLARGVEGQDHRVFGPPGPEQPGERLARLRREGGQAGAALQAGVGGQQPHATAIGQDGQLVAEDGLGAHQRPGAVEQGVDAVHPDQAGTAEGHVVDGVGLVVGLDQADALGQVARLHRAGLEHQDGLVAGAGPGRGHEPPGVGDGFDVEQDGAGGRVRAQVVETGGEIGIELVAQRDEVGEADIVGLGPVEDGGEQAVGLGDEGRATRAGRGLGQARVQAVAGHDEPEAAGSEQAHPTPPGRGQGVGGQGLLPPGLGAGQAGGEQDGAARPARAQAIEGLGHGFGLLADHGQVRRQRQVLDGFVGQHAVDGLELRGDGHDRPQELAREQVAHDDGAGVLGLVRGPDDGNGLWPEEGVEIGDAHWRSEAFLVDGRAGLVQAVAEKTRPEHTRGRRRTPRRQRPEEVSWTAGRFRRAASCSRR